MEKAILVLDMPKNCYECNLQVHNPAGEHICVINRKSADYCASKADGCPLKEMDKKEWAHTENPMRAYGSGWNACIDAILNGGKENV